MRIYILLASLFFLSQGLAQSTLDNYTINVLPVKYKKNYRTASTLYNTVKEATKEDFHLSSQSPIMVKPVIVTDDARLIEGMDIKHTGVARIEFHFSEKVSDEKEVYVFEEKVSEVSASKIGESLVESFVQNIEKQQELSSEIEVFCDNVMKKNCAAYRTLIEENNNKQAFAKSLILLVNYTKSKCDPNANQLLQTTLSMQDKHYCDVKIQKASIMVNSGVEFQMNRAIPLLLSISPNAPCSDEALQLSKLIGDKMKGNSDKTVKINQYSSYQNNYEGWKASYIQEILNN